MRAIERPAAVALAIAALVVAAYAPSLAASFQFDDFNVVVRDARVQSLAAWWAALPSIRPVLRFTYALQHEFGASVAGFRALNIAIHAANAVLAWMLLRALGERVGASTRVRDGAACTAALVFALHPMATEAVTYVSGRANGLMGLFALAALVLGVHAGERARGWVTLAAIACALLAVAVKESALVVPFALLVCALVVHRDAALDRALIRRRAVWMIVVLGVCGFVFALATPYAEMLASAVSRRDPLVNALTQANGIAALFGHVVMPWRVATEFGLREANVTDVGAWAWLGAWLGAIVGAIVWRRRAPVLAFAVLWTAVWLLPTNSVFAREDIANDRQMYLPLIGIAWAVAIVVWRWAEAGASSVGRRDVRRVAVAGGAIVCVLATLASNTVLRNRDYATEVTFWEAAVASAPENARARNNLGYAYAQVCRDAEALREFDRAVALAPDDFRARMNAVLLRRGELFEDGELVCARVERR